MIAFMNSCGDGDSKYTHPPVPIAKVRHLQSQGFDMVIDTIDKRAGNFIAPVELFFLKNFGRFLNIRTGLSTVLLHTWLAQLIHISKK